MMTREEQQKQQQQRDTIARDVSVGGREGGGLVASGVAGVAGSSGGGSNGNEMLSGLMPAYDMSAAGPTGTPYNTRSMSRRESTVQMMEADEMMMMMDDSEDEQTARAAEKRSGRRKIRIEYIEDKSRRHITFSKRKAGIMKKAYELSTLTGTQVLLLVASETGHVYTFATPKLQPLITKPEGKNLIQACLNSPDHLHHGGGGGFDGGGVVAGAGGGGGVVCGGDEKEHVYDDRPANVGLAANYTAAMAGMAAYPYGVGSGYPAYAAAMAANYWQQQQHAAAIVNERMSSSQATPPQYSPPPSQIPNNPNSSGTTQ